MTTFVTNMADVPDYQEQHVVMEQGCMMMMVGHVDHVTVLCLLTCSRSMWWWCHQEWSPSLLLLVVVNWRRNPKL